MNIIKSNLPDVLIIEPRVFGDARGFLFESFNARAFAQATGINAQFVQDNHSRSARGVLRGLHYQLQNPQGKLVRCSSGEVWDVVVDLRRSSPTFRQWTGARLSEANKRLLWVPPGFAHGFIVLSETADFLYKMTSYYDPASERTIMWNDPVLKVDWKVEELGGMPPTLSPRDASGTPFDKAEFFD
jgi:dTDP-4-dehydrorhamnose 3,5-epimerase